MKHILFLLLAFSLCFAQTDKQADINILKERVSSLENKQNTLETRQDTVEKSVNTLNNKFFSDNFISVKAAKETQELHNVAFDKMQKSFNIFIIAIGIFAGFFSLLNSKQVRDLKKDIREEINKLERKSFESNNGEYPFVGRNKDKINKDGIKKYIENTLKDMLRT
jgi:predicted nuclease with TOPRIM domain